MAGENLRFAILGPVRAWRDEVELSLGSPQQRLTLALLLLHEGQPVPVDVIADAMWGDAVPRGARTTIRTYIYRLRRLLEQEGAEPLIVFGANGYALRVPPDAVDVARFHQQVSRATSAREQGDIAAEAKHLRLALSEWTGTPLADVTGPLVEREQTHLERLRVGVTEQLITARLELGQHAEVVDELMALVAAQPLHERFRELLMLALHRAGRSAEALLTYEQLRELLRDELGADPAPALQRLHQRILQADPNLLVQSTDTPPVVAPAQLPANLPVFVGREDQLSQLLGFTSEVTPVVVLCGMAGVGKTTLAVHWAHQIADRFPDGQLYVNLRGFDPDSDQTTPEEALSGFLQALGIPSHQIPDDRDARAALFRGLLARRRMLLLLDNARDSDQVLPLLPASDGCLVIVTSRHQLSGLVTVAAAHPITVGLMAMDEAHLLLTRRIGKERVNAEPLAVEQIITLCARLPLALSVVAARAATRPTFSLADIADELRATRGNLDPFARTGASGNIRAVFSWSIRALSPGAARLFRLLAVHPGTEISVGAAASIAAEPLRTTAELLTELTEAHLLGEHRPGHYNRHDLVRAYANECLANTDAPGEQRAAELRLLDHYLHTAAAADRFYTAHRDYPPLGQAVAGTYVPQLNSYDEASTWFASEHENLLAVIARSGELGLHGYTWRLAWMIRHVQDRRGNWHAFMATQRLAMAAAEALGDRKALGYASRGASRSASMIGRHEEAQRYLEKTLTLFQEEGDTLATAYALRQLSGVRSEQNDPVGALELSERALALFREAGCPVGEAAGLNIVGYYNARLERFEETLHFCQQALALFLSLDERFGEAETWHSLGYAHHRLGRHAEAAACYQRALELFRELEAPREQADALTHLHSLYIAAGQAEKAQQVFHEAQSILTALDPPDAEHVRTTLRELA